MLFENEDCVCFYDGRFGIMIPCRDELFPFFHHARSITNSLLEANWFRCSFSGYAFPKTLGGICSFQLQLQITYKGGQSHQLI